MTGDALHESLELAERDYRAAAERAESLLRFRNEMICHALAAGWTHARIAEATGLSRGRISQIPRGE
jgi:DNA-binding NarL/FixJ family response regulator